MGWHERPRAARNPTERADRGRAARRARGLGPLGHCLPPGSDGNGPRAFAPSPGESAGPLRDCGIELVWVDDGRHWNVHPWPTFSRARVHGMFETRSRFCVGGRHYAPEGALSSTSCQATGIAGGRRTRGQMSYATSAPIRRAFTGPLAGGCEHPREGTTSQRWGPQGKTPRGGQEAAPKGTCRCVSGSCRFSNVRGRSSHAAGPALRCRGPPTRRVIRERSVRPSRYFDRRHPLHHICTTSDGQTPVPECRERGGAHPPAGRCQRVGAATPDAPVRGYLGRASTTGGRVPLADPAVLVGLVVAEENGQSDWSTCDRLAVPAACGPVRRCERSGLPRPFGPARRRTRRADPPRGCVAARLIAE